MARVGLVIHEDRPEAVTQATQLAGRLTEQGHAVRRSDDPALEAEAFVDGLDLVVSMGGDGSILRAVHLLDGRPVPVLGVNFGHLGYLTTVEPTAALDAVGRFMEGMESPISGAKGNLEYLVHVVLGGTHPGFDPAALVTGSPGAGRAGAP